MGKHKEKKHKSKKPKKEKKHKKKSRYSSSDSESSEDEWVEKSDQINSNDNLSKAGDAEERLSGSGENFDSGANRSSINDVTERSDPKREDWLSLPGSLFTASNHDRRKEREAAKRLKREADKYDPGKNVRELNPHWRDGGDGLPSKFKKPNYDDADESKHKPAYKNQTSRSSSWRKKPVEEKEQDTETKSKNAQISNNAKDNSPVATDVTVLSDKEMNALAAKIVKAEILGNTSLAVQLKAKLEKAKNLREIQPIKLQTEEEIVLTRTDSKGYTRPVKLQSDYGEGSSKKKKQKIETHSGGERVRYFADDDKVSLQQMFENEKFNSAEDQNREFMGMAGKSLKNDDLDEIFTDKIRRKESDAKVDERNRSKAIGEHQSMQQSLDNCSKCLQSDNMLKHLMIAMTNLFYLSLPAHEPLTNGHCLLTPIRHVSCATQLDENEWEDLMNFRRALTKMFNANDEDVIFFETAMYFNRHPHMILECIPVSKETGDLAPIYFKKAIDESEMEWSTNKKLISLAGRNVCKAVPKGLPYFSVSFGLEEGFAHVIEDQQLFPKNFAQEIIGGMMDLDHRIWRKPKRQSFDEQSKGVVEFSKLWKQFDCTNN